ncbi:MAG: hypothetical protein NTU53_11500 [Planctomycetota bacterium]|nr:hypothetical protein [Planctomycetota bacterium]
MKWKDVNFAAQDLKTRCTAVLALKQVLTTLGGKADARIDLLVDYLNQQKLGETFAAQMGEIPEPMQVSYDDALKLAVAMIQSPMGAAKFDDELEGCNDSMLKAYLAMYDKGCRRAFDEVIESRHEVRAMGLFLEKQGKFVEFGKWADAETKRRQMVFEQEQAQKRTLAVKEQVARKEEAQAAAEERRRLEQEQAARDMEMAMQYQQQQVGGDPQTVVVDGGHSYGSTWYPGTGAYYASAAYRGYVRDKRGDAIQKWRPRPTPNRAGHR